MSTNKTLSIYTTNSDETVKLGEAIGNKLRGGEVIELSSDLGGGKTTFVQGLAKGMDSNDKVASPTFMICKQYTGRGLTIYHYDFYRLNDTGLIRHELEEGLEDDSAVIVVEWADIIKNTLPTERCTIEIKASEEHERLINISYPDKFDYLFVSQT